MKEPSIMKMDWKALGYERQYKDGIAYWEKVSDSDSSES
jgi:hypothetical protein